MIVTLDGQRVNTPISAGATLQGLIEQVRAAHDNRLIVSVALNGTQLSDDNLTEQLARAVPEDVQIDLESGDAQQLVSDALHGLALQFAELGPQQPAIADRISAGEAAEGVQDVGACVGLWNTCHRVLTQCSGLLNQDLREFVHDGRPVQAWFEDVVGKLTEIRQALEAHDLVLLSDLVRYELPALCQVWEGLLNSLGDQVASPP